MHFFSFRDHFSLPGVQVGFNPTEYAVAESEGVVNLIVRKFTESAIPVTVLFSTMAGTASGVYTISSLSVGVDEYSVYSRYVPTVAKPTFTVQNMRKPSLVPRLHSPAFYRTVYRTVYTWCDKKLGSGVWERGYANPQNADFRNPDFHKKLCHNPLLPDKTESCLTRFNLLTAKLG